jgi:hypothetical protein
MTVRFIKNCPVTAMLTKTHKQLKALERPPPVEEGHVLLHDRIKF